MITQTMPQMRKTSRLSLISSIHKLLVQRLDSTLFVHSDVESHTLRTSDVTFNINHSHNYKLTRMDLRVSVDSNFSHQTQYRVSLDLSPKEITLLRYTWSKMLVEEPLEERKSALPIPGSMWQLLAEKIQPSSRQTLGVLSTFCTQLYLNLLNMDPQLERMFPSLRHQATSMAGVMTFALNLLENLSCLDEYLCQLGKRHLRILNIEPFQFEMMGEALIYTFVERFGTRFTNELEVLWIKFYLYLANSLIQFGIDPVLRLGTQVCETTGVYSESVFSVDSLNTTMSDTRRASNATTTTAKTSLASFLRPVAEFGKPLPGHPKPLPVKEGNEPKETKKTRFRRKKGDCVIV